MRSSSCSSSLLLLAACSADIKWIENDLPRAEAEAKKTGRPIFLIFRCER